MGLLRRRWERLRQKILKILMFIFRESEKEREREGEKHRSVASHNVPNWGPGP